jgi:hypothetical protein
MDPRFETFMKSPFQPIHRLEKFHVDTSFTRTQPLAQDQSTEYEEVFRHFHVEFLLQWSDSGTLYQHPTNLFQDLQQQLLQAGSGVWCIDATGANAVVSPTRTPLTSSTRSRHNRLLRGTRYKLAGVQFSSAEVHGEPMTVYYG